jgi:hypothetical protein
MYCFIRIRITQLPVSLYLHTRKDLLPNYTSSSIGGGAPQGVKPAVQLESTPVALLVSDALLR